MLYHNYWEKVLGSQVKVKILRALLRYPAKKFTIRELAKFIGVSHTPVLRSLNDLQGMNLINLEKHGTANLLTFNAESHLHQVLADLFSFEQQTANHLITQLKSTLPPVKMAVLFGSVPKAAEKMDSDIDLLIIAEDKKKIEKELDEKQLSAIKEFGNLLSPLILTLSEFKKKKHAPFAKDLIKSYVLIKGEDLIKRHWI